ncbi:MAG TPA: hypothetical protein VKU62_11065 [Thermoanaerobaculia bacterium]|nr:hypothetical protein [Thermoanaerobaculia bacterium]
MKRWIGVTLVAAMLAPAAIAQKPMDDCPMMKKSADVDAKLQALVDDMNKADGQAKIDKMAAVINELVAQCAAAMPMDTKNCPMMKKGAMKMKKTASMPPKSCH